MFETPDNINNKNKPDDKKSDFGDKPIGIEGIKAVPEQVYRPKIEDKKHQQKRDDKKYQQERGDEERVAEIREQLFEMPERVSFDSESAKKYIDKYWKKFGRKETMPTESEQLQYLQRFVKKDELDDLLNTLHQSINNPDSLRKRVYNLFHRSEQKKKNDTVNALLQEERDNIDDNEFAKSRQPIIIGVRKIEKSHGLNKGDYVFATDQFGTQYFKGPDLIFEKDYADTLRLHFNVNVVKRVKFPSDICPYPTMNSKLVLKEYDMVQQLRETSKSVDDTLLKPEDCDKIDPMPVTNPNKSFVAGVVMNLVTGANDCVIRANEEPGFKKNYHVRKDGVYYLYDLIGSYDERVYNMASQMIELQNFFNSLDSAKEKEELIEYFVKSLYDFVALVSLHEVGYVRSEQETVPRKIYKRIGEFIKDDNLKKEILKMFIKEQKEIEKEFIRTKNN